MTHRSGNVLEVLALVIDRANECRVGPCVGVLVTLYSVVVPATLPQRVNDVEVLVRDLISLVMLDRLSQSHVARSTGEVRGHNVPSLVRVSEHIE